MLIQSTLTIPSYEVHDVVLRSVTAMSTAGTYVYNVGTMNARNTLREYHGRSDVSTIIHAKPLPPVQKPNPCWVELFL